MGNIHVSRSLDQDQRIFRFISFYDLIDLLTFSQISFSSFDRMQNGLQHQPVERKKNSLRNVASKTNCDQTGVSESDKQSKDSSQTEPALGYVMHQSGNLLEQEDSIDWHARDMSQPRICIFSNIRALSESFFTDEATEVFIDRTYRVTQSSTSSKLLRARALTVLQDDKVSVFVSSAGGPMHISRQQNGMRLLVDLKTLLIGVIVSPDASIRFVELTSKLVQRTTCAFVSRANRPKEQRCARGLCSLSAQYPTYSCTTENAAKLTT